MLNFCVEVPLDWFELATGLAGEDVVEVEELAGVLAVGGGAPAVRTCDRDEDADSVTDDEDDETGVCGGALPDAEIELEDGGGDPPEILVIVKAGLVLPESPYRTMR